jgi:hypothetical protein
MKSNRRTAMMIPNSYDFVVDATNANGEWLDVYCKSTKGEYKDFEVLYVIGGTEDGGIVEAMDRYDDCAEGDVENAWLEWVRG